ncbi:MAG: hypothetical protein ACYDCO_17795 [Armatimonadota bacterium]
MNSEAGKAVRRRNGRRWLWVSAAMLLLSAIWFTLAHLLPFKVPEWWFVSFIGSFTSYLFFWIPSSDTAPPAPFSQVKVSWRERMVIVAGFLVLVLWAVATSYLFDEDKSFPQRLLEYGGGVLGFPIGFFAAGLADALTQRKG